MRQNILFICHRIPYPPNKGDKIRSYNILRHLLGHHGITLACLLDDPRDEAHLTTLRGLVSDLFHDTFSARQKKIQSMLPALLHALPVSVPYFYSRGVQEAIDRHLDRHAIDVVLCSSSPSAEYIFKSRHYTGKLQSARWIMDFIDMDSVKWRDYAEKQQRISGWVYRREARLLLEYEKRIAREFSHALIVSEAERKTFLEFIPGAKITAVSNGVDLDYFHPAFTPSLKLPGVNLVFTGAMDYWPNVEGAVWFAEKVFPRIQAAYPAARFIIAGSNPAPEIVALRQRQGILVTGFVEDMREYLAVADLCVIPLFIARGIQNKVLEAMAMGKAVVSTPQAAEGIPAENGRNLLLASDAPSFTEAVMTLLRDAERAKQTGNLARATVEENFSWEKNLTKLDVLLADS